MLNLKRIQDTRVDNDITQKQMADILNVSKYVYNNFESGRTKIPLDKIIEFADYFNLNLDYLLNLTDEKKYQHYNKVTTKNLNKTLLKIRKDINLSQEKFGKLIGVPQRTYASYENGERSIPINILIKIALKTNYSVDYLTSRIK